MRQFGWLAGFIIALCGAFACKSEPVYEVPLVLLNVEPLPQEVVVKTQATYEPVYGLTRILEVSEVNGVQKLLLAKIADIKQGVKIGVTGDISPDATFAEIIGTFSIKEISNGFFTAEITSVTHKIGSNAYVRIQIGQKIKGE